jgi:hypothetical protein
MKFKIPCQTSLLSLVLVVCGAILSDNLQAMSPAASAARKKVLANLQTQIGALEDISNINNPSLPLTLTGLIPNIKAAVLSKNSVANFTPITSDVSYVPVAGRAGSTNRGFSLMDMAIMRTLGTDGEGVGNPSVLFSLLYLGAPAYSFVNNNYKQTNEFTSLMLSRLHVPLSFSLPSGGMLPVGTLYHAIKAGNLSSVCATAATDPNLQIVGNDVNNFFLGASCATTSDCCGNNVCNNGVCDISGTPVTTCPTVPCPSGYSCVLNACVKNAPVACTASSCGVGNYCNVATGNCVAGCLTAANCGGATALCDITSQTCVAQIPGTDTGCFKAADCVLGACSVSGGVIPGACSKPVGPAACTASSCGVGNYCNVATGNCVAGCLTAANCGGTTALCDTTLKTCVAQIQGTDSGCSKAADCALGACSSGTCAKPAGPATCLTDASCGAGNYCDLTVGTCVTGATIPANHGCTNLGVATGGCAARLACQPTQASSGPANTCQALTCSAPNASGCMPSGSSTTDNGCLDGTNCCSCACSNSYTCQG